MTIKELQEYCKVKGIFIPSGAPKEYLEAAIVKAFEHMGEKVKRDSCFGYYSGEDAVCLTVCELSEPCSKATLGMPREKYMKAFNRKENAKIRIEPMVKRKRKRKLKRRK